MDPLLYWLDKIQLSERSLVGDKAFYLSQQAQAGRAIVPGFAIAAPALREFLTTYQWSKPFLGELLTSTLHLNVHNVYQLQELAKHIRQEICAAELPEAWVNQLNTAVNRLNAPVLIFRPSLVPQDTSTISKSGICSPQMSGILESRICTNHPDALIQIWKETWAELFTARSLFYWQRSGISLQNLDLAILVQPIWNAIAAGSLETRADIWEIKATWGLGMSIPAGKTIPDIYQINPATGKVQQKTLGNKLIAYNLGFTDSKKTQSFADAIADRPTPQQLLETPLKAEVSTTTNLDFCQCIQPLMLTEAQQKLYCLQEPYLSNLIRLTKSLVSEFSHHFVLEWLVCLGNTPENSEYFDPDSPSFQNAKFYLTQLSWLDHSQRENRFTDPSLDKVNHLPDPRKKDPLLVGLGAAPGEAIAPAFVIGDSGQIPEKIPPGSIIVTKTINVETLCCLQQAVGVIAEQGGMTSHAAILARELGIPAVVSAVGATLKIEPDQRLLINGDKGAIYHIIEQSPEQTDGSTARTDVQQLDKISKTHQPGNLEIMNSTFPPIATQLLINLSQPKSLEKIANLPVDGVGLLRSEMMMLDILNRQHPQQWIEAGRQEELVQLMSDRVGEIAQYMFPRPVFYRAADLRSDEYPNQEKETNPALGVHGAFSYLVDSSLFELELAVLDRVQTDGWNNINLILPFVRSVEEFVFCRQRVEQTGLTRVNSFQLWIMAEVPSVLFLLEDYIKAGVKGIAIGTNDLTQLLLGSDRNQLQFQSMFEGRHPAVKAAIFQLISAAKKFNIPAFIYGHNPAIDYNFIDDLVNWGVTGISVELMLVTKTYEAIARAEKRLLLEAARHSLNLKK